MVGKEKEKSKKEKRVKKQLHERNFIKKFEGKFSWKKQEVQMNQKSKQIKHEIDDEMRKFWNEIEKYEINFLND